MADLVAQQENLEPTASEVAFSGINANISDIYERAKVDINFFAGLMLPQVMTFPFPPFYVAIFKVICHRQPDQIGKILRFALGLPRGHAKTTFVKILIAWLIAYDKFSFVVALCATDPLAEELISDVSDMLGSENAEEVYGRWTSQLTTDSKELKKAVYHKRNIILAAKGAGSAVRGINIKHRRPDIIFCDDAQTKECDESPVEALRFRKRLIATFKIINPIGDRLIIYVGNMYSDTCVLYQLKNNSSWISLITGAILDNGEPLWPELHSLDELMDSYIHDESMQEADVWFAEVMNAPVSRAQSLITDTLPTHNIDEKTVVPDGVFITIDPAGFRDNSDDNVIVTHYIVEGKGAVARIEAGIKDPEQLIIAALREALDTGASLIAVEETGYQQTLLYWLKKYISEWDINGIEVQPLKPKGRTKESRIRLFVKELYARNYYLLPTASASFIWQAMKYKLGLKKNKDDILDACAYGLDVRNEYWHLVTNRNTSSRRAIKAIVVEDNTPF